MKTKRLHQLWSKYVDASLQERYRPCGPSFLDDSVVYFAKGFCVESSGFSADSIRVQCFIQPLFVPAPGEVFKYSVTIGAQHWNDVTPENEPDVMKGLSDAMMQDGRPFLEKVSSLELFVHHQHELARPFIKELHLEDRACAYVLLGRQREAMQEIKAWKESIDMTSERYREVNANLMARALRLEEALRTSVESAQQMLCETMAQMRAVLKLTDK